MNQDEKGVSIIIIALLVCIVFGTGMIVGELGNINDNISEINVQGEK